MMLQVRDLHLHYVVHHNPLARFRHPDHVIRAVDGVSLAICESEVFGIIGESGSGKTSLARAMLRLSMPTSGSIQYRGSDLSTLDGAMLRHFRREVQPVFQDADSTLDPRQHVGAILEEPLIIHRIGDRPDREKRISAVLQQVNLSPSFLQRHPAELSGGQRRRVAMARALLLDPAMLIADEPTSGLDPLVATQMLALMLQLKRERRLTLVLISHDLATVAYASDRIAVMYRGRVVELANGDDFEARCLHPYTRFLLGIAAPKPDMPLQQDIHEHLHDTDEGCPYLHACPHHQPRCHHEAPRLLEVAKGHLVACHAAI